MSFSTSRSGGWNRPTWRMVKMNWALMAGEVTEDDGPVGGGIVAERRAGAREARARQHSAISISERERSWRVPSWRAASGAPAPSGRVPSCGPSGGAVLRPEPSTLPPSWRRSSGGCLLGAVFLATVFLAGAAWRPSSWLRLGRSLLGNGLLGRSSWPAPLLGRGLLSHCLLHWCHRRLWALSTADFVAVDEVIVGAFARRSQRSTPSSTSLPVAKHESSDVEVANDCRSLSGASLVGVARLHSRRRPSDEARGRCPGGACRTRARRTAGLADGQDVLRGAGCGIAHGLEPR